MFKKKKKEQVIETEITENIKLEEVKVTTIEHDFSEFEPHIDESIDEVLTKDYTDKIEVIKEIVETEESNKIDESNSEKDFKKDLSTFFKEDKKKNKKLRNKKTKDSKKPTKKHKELQDVKDRKVYKYKKKKYTKVEDFVKFLQDHYIDMDDIAKIVLEDENFYGWLGKRSGVLEQSLKDYKEIKEKIEKSS